MKYPIRIRLDKKIIHLYQTKYPEKSQSDFRRDIQKWLEEYAFSLQSNLLLGKNRGIMTSIIEEAMTDQLQHTQTLLETITKDYLRIRELISDET